MHSTRQVRRALKEAATFCLGCLLSMFEFGAPLMAQPKRPEIFGLAGVGRVSGDDGYLARGVALGGAVTLPFANRWAVDVDVTHIRGERRVTSDFKLAGRHTHISPALQYRRGNENIYGFFAFGAGATVSTEPNENRQSGYSRTHTGFQWHAKAGVVKRLSRRLLLRADFGTYFQPVSLDLGARVGLGWRF